MRRYLISENVDNSGWPLTRLTYADLFLISKLCVCDK